MSSGGSVGDSDVQPVVEALFTGSRAERDAELPSHAVASSENTRRDGAADHNDDGALWAEARAATETPELAALREQTTTTFVGSSWATITDILERVLEFLPVIELRSARQVSLAWYNSASSTVNFWNGQSSTKLNASALTRDLLADQLGGGNTYADANQRRALRLLITCLSRDLEALDLRGGNFSYLLAGDGAVKCLLQLPSLTALDIGQETVVRSTSLAAVPTQNKLRVLRMQRSAVRWPPSSAAILARFTQLREIALTDNGGAFRDASLRYLSGMKYLRRLDVSGSAGLTGQGLQHLLHLKHLKSVVLDRCWDLSDDAFITLGGMHGLKSIVARGCPHLSCTSLRNLVLSKGTLRETLTTLRLQLPAGTDDVMLQSDVQLLLRFKALEVLDVIPEHSPSAMAYTAELCRVLRKGHQGSLPALRELGLPTTSNIACIGEAFGSQLRTLRIVDCSSDTNDVFESGDASWVHKLNHLHTLDLSAASGAVQHTMWIVNCFAGHRSLKTLVWQYDWVCDSALVDELDQALGEGRLLLLEDTSPENVVALCNTLEATQFRRPLKMTIRAAETKQK